VTLKYFIFILTYSNDQKVRFNIILSECSSNIEQIQTFEVIIISLLQFQEIPTPKCRFKNRYINNTLYTLFGDSTVPQ